MKILTPISSRTEVIVSALLAVTCHAAALGFVAASRTALPAVELAAYKPALRVTLIPSQPVVREKAAEPVREMIEIPDREEAAATVREEARGPAVRTGARKVKEPAPDRTRKRSGARERRKDLPMREDAIRPEDRLLVKRDEVHNPNEALSRDAVLEGKTVIEYPRYAIDLGWEGRVILSILVSEQGRPVKAEVKVSSGHSYLDRSAVRQVMERFRFRPALKDGRPESRWVEQSINFSLIDEKASVVGALP